MGDASAESGDGAYKIALIQQHQTNAFQIGVTEGAQAKADELGVELNILSADQDAAKQISQIEQCVSGGYDAILFEPVDPDGLRDAAKAAADAGVIMINIVSACTDWESAGISAVSCGDNVKAGENEMQHVADLLGGKGQHRHPDRPLLHHRHDRTPGGLSQYSGQLSGHDGSDCSRGLRMGHRQGPVHRGELAVCL